MNDKQIVDEIIHYLKLNNSGHIDRDNVFDVLVSYIEGEDANVDEVKQLEDEIDDLKESIKDIIRDLQHLV